MGSFFSGSDDRALHRLRNGLTGQHAWKAALIGTQLLLITGLDFIPVIILSIASRITIGKILFPDGRIEGWNMPIMSWLNAITWVPNHIAATLSCVMALLVVLSGMRKLQKRTLHRFNCRRCIDRICIRDICVDCVNARSDMGNLGLCFIFFKGEPHYCLVYASGRHHIHRVIDTLYYRIAGLRK